MNDNDTGRLRASIRSLFDQHYADTNNKSYSLFTDQFYRDLKEQILEDSGKYLSNFLNSEILNVIVKGMVQD